MDTGRFEDIGYGIFPGNKLSGAMALQKKTGFVRDFGLKEQIHPGTIWQKVTLKQ